MIIDRLRWLAPLLLLALTTSAKATTHTFAILGDAGVWNSNSRRIRDSILDSRIKAMILPGDNLYEPDRDYADVWSPWQAKGLEFPIVALGNHYKSYSEEMAYFGMPGEFYAKTYPGFRFIVLNSDNPRNVGEQYEFARTQLAQADEKFVFLVYHHPTFTVSRRHGWQEREAFQRGMRQLLRRYADKITAVIVGHDHIASLVQVDEIPMIVSGAAFEQIPTRPVSYVDDGFQIGTRWLFRSGPHWVRLDVDPDEGEHVWINFVRTDRNEVVCSARIAPRPFVLRENCARSSVRLPKKPRSITRSTKE